MRNSMKKQDGQSKLDLIPEQVGKLKILKSKGPEEFISDFCNVDSAMHRRQTLIQAFVDVGAYIIASLELHTPSSSAEVIDILAEHGLLPTEQRD